MSNTIVLGCDHGGLALKALIIAHLKEHYPQYTCQDLGTHSEDSTDYPDYAKQVAKAVQSNPNALGILCCGTGIGMSIQANRFSDVRAALVFDAFTAQMAKEHNNANILCLGARTLDPKDSLSCLDIWLTATFEGGRHANRLQKIDS